MTTQTHAEEEKRTMIPGALVGVGAGAWAGRTMVGRAANAIINDAKSGELVKKAADIEPAKKAIAFTEAVRMGMSEKGLTQKQIDIDRLRNPATVEAVKAAIKAGTATVEEGIQKVVNEGGKLEKAIIKAEKDVNRAIRGSDAFKAAGGTWGNIGTGSKAGIIGAALATTVVGAYVVNRLWNGPKKSHAEQVDASHSTAATGRS